MLKSIELVNFQRHSNIVIDVDPKITTIVGPTDAGKSSLLRAFRWVMLNQPGGDTFIKHDERQAKAILNIDGHQITRSRGKDGNLYFLDGGEFVAFGSTVPSKIADIVNVTEINFQKQHDSPFWFGDSAGEVSRQLNAVVDLEIIDKSLAKISAQTAHYRTEAAICKERFDKAKEKVSQLKWATDADLALKKVEQILFVHTESQNRLQSLKSLISTAKAKIKEEQYHHNRWIDLKVILNLASKWNAENTKLAALRTDIESAKKNLAASQYKEIDTTRLDTLVRVLDRRYSTLGTLSRTLSSAKVFLKQTTYPIFNHERVEQIVYNLQQKQSMLNQLKKIISEMKRHQTKINAASKYDTDKLSVIFENYTRAKSKLGAIQDHLIMLKIHSDAQYIQAELEISIKSKIKDKFSDICPTCGTPIVS